MYLHVIGTFLFSFCCSLTGYVGGQTCQDIDPNACVLYEKQNANMCSDPILSTTACPAYCSNCPITCYSCNTTSSDIRNCNTVTCKKDEMCMRVSTKTGSMANSYKMMCGPNSVCMISGKRHVQRDLTIECCSDNLCNAPPTTTTTTTKTTASTTTTPPTTTKATTTPLTTFTSATTKSTPSLMVHSTSSSASCVRDVIFMIDDSLSVIPAMPAIKDCIAGVIDRLDIGYYKTRVALGTFSKEAHTRWELDRYTDKSSLLHAVYNLSPLLSFVYTSHNGPAVHHLENSFNVGNRANVPDAVVMLSGGHLYKRFLLNGHNHVTDADVSRLHQRSQNIIAIAAGHANQNDMRRIATDANHYFYISDPNHFDKQGLIRDTVKLICGN